MSKEYVAKIARSFSVALISWIGFGGPALADNAPPDPSFDALFSQVLANPTDVGLSLEYAHQAMERGEHRKAVSTYERILIQDPGNTEAQVGLNRVKLLIAPETTTWLAEAGASVASNVRHSNINEDSDVYFNGRLAMRDERRLGYNRWRTLASVGYDLHNDVDDLAAGLATVSTGPLIAGFGNYIFRPAAGVSYGWLDGESLYFETFGNFSLEGRQEHSVNSLSARIAHRDIDSNYSTKDGWLFDLEGRHSQRGIFEDSDVLTASARFRFSDSTGVDTKDNDPSTPLFPGDYTEFRGGLGYFHPIYGDEVSGGLTFTAYTRDYRTPVSGGATKDRHDFYTAPGAIVSFNDFCGQQCHLKFDYKYETNESNDANGDYVNHLGRGRVVFSF